MVAGAVCDWLGDSVRSLTPTGAEQKWFDPHTLSQLLLQQAAAAMAVGDSYLVDKERERELRQR